MEATKTTNFRIQQLISQLNKTRIVYTIEPMSDNPVDENIKTTDIFDKQTLLNDPEHLRAVRGPTDTLLLKRI